MRRTTKLLRNCAMHNLKQPPILSGSTKAEIRTIKEPHREPSRWNRQVDLQHFHDRSDQAFALAKRQSKHRSQSQGGFDGQIGIMALPAPRCSRLGLPTRNRIRRKPDSQAPAITQGCIIFSPVRDPMTLAGNVTSAFRRKLTWGFPSQGVKISSASVKLPMAVSVSKV